MMNGFKRLWGESHRFYLGVFAIVVLIVLADCMWICIDNNVSLTKVGVEQHVDNILSKENGISVLENYYMSFEKIGTDKGAEYGLMLAILGIMGLLCAREIVFTDVRTQEFRSTWPVKRWVRELYDYVAMLLTIVFGVLIQMVVLLLIQCRYNRVLLEVLTNDGIISKVTDEMSAANQYFLMGMAYYLLAVIVSYTWICLGMSLAKNPIAGALIAVLVKGLIQTVWTSLGWYVLAVFTSDANSMQAAYYYNDFADYIERVGSYLLIYQDFFNGVNVSSGVISGCENAFSVTHWLIAQIAFLMLLVGSLIVSAKRKDLAKGKIFYFPIISYPLGLLVGLAVFVISVENFLYDISLIGWLVAVVLGFVSAIGTCLLCHPFSKSKIVRLEVK